MFDAPREEVWRAWTEPERIAEWWGKRGWSTPVSSVELDVRPGGVFRLNSINDEDGREMPVDTVYSEVVEPERLVFGTSSVTFVDLGDGQTEMQFEARAPRWPPWPPAGWPAPSTEWRNCCDEFDFRLEVIIVPVADVDRAKAYYADQMGFNVDHDTKPKPGSVSASSPRPARHLDRHRPGLRRRRRARSRASSSSSTTWTPRTSC